MQYRIKSYEPRVRKLQSVIDRFKIGHGSNRVFKHLFYRQSVRYVDKPRSVYRTQKRGVLKRLWDWVKR